MAHDYSTQTKNQYSSILLRSVQRLQCRGNLKYYHKNCFTYVQIPDVFSTIPTEILKQIGYQEVPLMAKVDSPRTHISVMTTVEQRRTTRSRAKKVWKKWKDKKINFKIVDVQIWPHTTKETEERKWICSFSVRSQQVEEIRADLGWQPMQHFYNMHITLCEKPV
jgi:hypothetical protein